MIWLVAALSIAHSPTSTASGNAIQLERLDPSAVAAAGAFADTRWNQPLRAPYLTEFKGSGGATIAPYRSKLITIVP